MQASKSLHTAPYQKAERSSSHLPRFEKYGNFNEPRVALRVIKKALLKDAPVELLSNPQNPAPFVVLLRNLSMAVTYDPTVLDTTIASVADRLRKQIKTHAVKVIREVIVDKRCFLTASELRGHRGPLSPSDAVTNLVAEKAVAIEGDSRKR